MKPLFLGVDTSNYTTSAALVGEDVEVLLNCKLPLPVKEGERGLRQSDAVFHHVKNLPTAAREVREALKNAPEHRLAAVGCSATPRDAEGSYMPCFLAGLSSAEMTAAAAGIPLYRFSHQAGHVMAALVSATSGAADEREKYLKEPFLAFHVSGGTTDLLLCEPDDEKILKITEIGGSRDINAGQAIDRTGVLMGLSFPAGAAMDKAACAYEGRTAIPRISVDGTRANLSGIENKAQQLWEKTGDVGEVSAMTFGFLTRTLEEMTKNALKQHGNLPVLYAGGVMSSVFIRRMLSRYGLFADAAFSSDNAAGTAALAAYKWKRSGEGNI